MVKSMKKVKRIIAVALVFTMLFASQVTVFAAGTKDAMQSANKDMSIALMPGVTGDSNTVTFKIFAQLHVRPCLFPKVCMPKRF